MSYFKAIKWLLIYPAIIIIVLSLAVSFSYSSFRSQVDNEITALYSSSGSFANKNYHSTQLAGLPEPVQRYFGYSLKEGQKYISYARLKQGGLYRPSQSLDWMSIEAEEYFSTKNPGYLWYAQIRPISYTWLSARDTYSQSKGNVLTKLFSGVTVANSEGNETDQGAMIRWLSEAVWYPTALLPSENMRWEGIDNRSAKAFFSDRGRTVAGIFHFNELGEITSFTADRFMGKSLEKFEIRYMDYKKFLGMKIPTRADATWHLKAGDYTYARFNVTEIDYEKAEKYPIYAKDL
jgi:hypothetical protein